MTVSLDCDDDDDDDVSGRLSVDCEFVERSDASPSLLQPLDTHDVHTETVTVSGCHEQTQTAVNDLDVSTVRRRPASLRLDLHTRHMSTSSSSSSSSAAAAAAAAGVANTPTFRTPVESPSQLLTTSVDSPTTYAKTRHFAQSPVNMFRNMTQHVTDDAYMSPLLATDHLLAQMCPLYCVVSTTMAVGTGGHRGPWPLIFRQGAIGDFGLQTQDDDL